VRSCARCGSELTATARFCARCGTPTVAERKRSARSVASRFGEAQRKGHAIAVIYGGVLGALVVSAFCSGDSENAQTVIAYSMFLLVGVAGALIQGGGSVLASCPLRCKATDVVLAAPIGLIGFGVAWAYVALLMSVLDEVLVPEEMSTMVMLSVIVLAPLLEEWLCRGVLWNAVRGLAGVNMTIVVTAMLFALMHGLEGFLLSLPHRFVAGLLLGWLREKSGSLVPGIVAHMIWNGMAVLAL